MRVQTTLVLVLLAALATGASPGGRGNTVRLARVIDGDTVVLSSGAHVRLLQIDTPELAGECYSRAARAALLRLTPPGAVVRLEADPGLDRLDRYGRLLRYLFRSRLNVNLELVREGAAAPYFYDGDRGRYADALMSAARAARASRRGLWRACPGTVLDPYHAVDTGAGH